MPGRKKYKIMGILATTAWILIAAATTVLLGAAIQKKDHNLCHSVEITIEGVKNNFFIDKADVYLMLSQKGFTNFTTKPLKSFDLSGMEAILEKNVWIRSAEMYFDNNDILKINIMEREPVVRIFYASGSSFYIDSSRKKLPLNSKFSARLPVFTNYPDVQQSASKERKLLDDIKNIGTCILNDPFWMAQVEQVELTPSKTFEMIPKIGNQVIIFGTAENYAEKFENLLIFYKAVQSKVGWNTYASINVSYTGQVVAVKREAGDIKSDSLKTMRLLKLLMANAQNQESESVNSIQLPQPAETNTIDFSTAYRPDSADETDALDAPLFNNADVKATPDVYNKKVAVLSPSKSLDTTATSDTDSNKPKVTIQKKTAWKSPVKKIDLPAKQPKAVMEAANEY